eukprot:gene5331-10658_t
MQQVYKLLSIIFLINCLPEIQCQQDGEGRNSRNRTLNNSHGNNPNRTVDQDDIERQNAAVAAAKAKRRYQEGVIAAKSTLRAAADESCDWRSHFFEIVRGEVCGKYYKILGLDKDADKLAIKKAYRSKSLDIHPDKNPSKSADEAFSVVNEAYECLVDSTCRKDYDSKLEDAEEQIQTWRREKVHTVKERATDVLTQAYLYLSMAAERYLELSSYLWDIAGKWIFADIPVGRWALLVGLLFRGRRLLFLQAAAAGLVRFNLELARSRGDTKGGPYSS